MQSLSDVATTEFQQALTPERLRVSQIIHFALVAAAMVFALIVIILFLTGIRREPVPQAFVVANVLSVVNVLMALTLPFVGWMIYRRQFSADRLRITLTQEYHNERGETAMASPAERCIMLMRTLSIIQLATLEGCAFFGLVVCINAVTDGIAYAEPAYLFNMVTSLPLLGYAVATFPTKDRLTNIFETRIRGNS